MKAFTIMLEEGGRHFKCFVQKIDGKSEDIYIVNFTDSILIRKYCAKKTIFYIDRNERAEGLIRAGKVAACGMGCGRPYRGRGE